MNRRGVKLAIECGGASRSYHDNGNSDDGRSRAGVGALASCVRLDHAGHSKYPWQIAGLASTRPGTVDSLTKPSPAETNRTAAMFACGRPEADVSSRTTQAETDLPRRLMPLAATRPGCKANVGRADCPFTPALLLASLGAISRNIRRAMRNKCSGKRLLRDEARIDL